MSLSAERTVVVIPADTNPGLNLAIYLQQAFNKRSANGGQDPSRGGQNGQPGSFGNEGLGNFDLQPLNGRFCVRALAEDPSRADEAKRRGCEVVRVNLDDANNIAENMRDAQLFFVAPPTHGDIRKRAENIAQALRARHEQNQRQGGSGGNQHQRVVLLTCRGVQQGHGQGLRELAEIERMFRERLEHICILRVDCPIQYFHFYADMVQREGRLRALTENKFRPIHFQDIGCATYCLLTGTHKANNGPTDSNQPNRQGRGRTYTLTGPEAVSPREIAERYMKNVEFAKGSREELERYLKSIGDQSSQYYRDQQQDQQRRARGDNGSDESSRNSDRDNFRFPRPFPPSDFEIKVELDYEEWVEQNPDEARRDTEDLRHITGSSGTRPQAFFDAHRDEFSGRRMT